MTAVKPEASRQAVVEAALVLLERMGLSPADLNAVPQHRPPRSPTASATGCRGSVPDRGRHSPDHHHPRGRGPGHPLRDAADDGIVRRGRCREDPSGRGGVRVVRRRFTPSG